MKFVCCSTRSKNIFLSRAKGVWRERDNTINYACLLCRKYTMERNGRHDVCVYNVLMCVCVRCAFVCVREVHHISLFFSCHCCPLFAIIMPPNVNGVHCVRITIFFFESFWNVNFHSFLAK